MINVCLIIYKLKKYKMLFLLGSNIRRSLSITMVIPALLSWGILIADRIDNLRDESMRVSADGHPRRSGISIVTAGY